MEEEGYDPPPQVIAYIEERTKMRKVRREAFIKDTRKIVGIQNRDKKAKRDAKLAADRKKKAELHQQFLLHKANESNTHCDEGCSQTSQTSFPTKKNSDSTVDSDDEPLIKKKTVKKKAVTAKKKTVKKVKKTTKKNLPVQRNTLTGYVYKGKVVKSTDDIFSKDFGAPEPEVTEPKVNEPEVNLKRQDIDSMSVSTCPKSSKDIQCEMNEYTTPYASNPKSNQVPTTSSTVSTSTLSLTNPFGSSLTYAPSVETTPKPNHQQYHSSANSYASRNPNDSVSSVDMICTNERCSPLDLNCVCRGCGNKFDSCFEYKLRKVCMHSVLDYFDDIGCDMVCELGIQKRYYSTFLSHSKASILENTTFWDLDDYMPLPECMKQGLFMEAVELMKFDDCYEYWMGFRVHNVARHTKRLANKTWQYKEGDKIVEDKTHFMGIDVPPYMKFFGKR